MAHPRKKGGVRKDKKNERLHEDLAARKAAAHPHKTTDKGDFVNYKPGGPDDSNRAIYTPGEVDDYNRTQRP